jgi:hypothetical protein
MIASAKHKRYFVRWRTALRTDDTYGGLKLVGWDVCDSRKFDNIAVASFGIHEKEQADAICKLLNSNEEIERNLTNE